MKDFEGFQYPTDERMEEALDGFRPAAFVTPDRRIYSEITLADDAGYYEVTAETFYRLLDLQMTMESMKHGELETSFATIAEEAKILQDTFLRAFEALKLNPMKKRGRA